MEDTNILFSYKHQFDNEVKKTDILKHKLDDDTLSELTDVTNRSKGQTQFLYNLLEGDLEKLKLLESQIKKHSCRYCPASLTEIDRVLSL